MCNLLKDLTKFSQNLFENRPSYRVVQYLKFVFVFEKIRIHIRKNSNSYSEFEYHINSNSNKFDILNLVQIIRKTNIRMYSFLFVRAWFKMVLKGLQKCFRAFSGEEISCSLTGLTYFHFPPTIRCAIIVEPDILIRF